LTRPFTLGFYFNSLNDKVVSDETNAKIGGRNLHVVADADESVNSYRVHAIVVDDDKKRVDVVFRATTNVTPKNAWHDWGTNFNAISKVSFDMDRSPL
jgi:hypothetical protein